MNRDKLIEAVSNELEYDPADVAKIWDGLMSDVLLAKEEGARVIWPGFGTFEWYKRKKITRRLHFNRPDYGRLVVIPEKVVLRFIPSLRFKRRIAA